MKGTNKVILGGRLGRDAQIRHHLRKDADGDGPVFSQSTHLLIGTEEVYTNTSGERKQRMNWQEVVAYGVLGERLANLKKGEILFIEGHTKCWCVKDESDNEEFITKIVVDVVLAT